jgi:hypothetical protein
VLLDLRCRRRRQVLGLDVLVGALLLVVVIVGGGAIGAASA